MKRTNQPSQSHSLCFLPWLRNLLLVLPVVFTANSAPAQQSVQAVPARTSAGQPVVPATANPAPTATPVSATASKPRVGLIAGAAPASQEQASNQEGALKSDGSMHQGLQVHGHWVINIRNADGALVEHREFENSLTGQGQGILVGLLSGYLVPGDWMIHLNQGLAPGNSPCPNNPCGIVHNANTQPAITFCGQGADYCTGSTLTYAFNLGNFGSGTGSSLVLNGTITAPQTGTVGSVVTILSACGNNAPDTGNPNSIETISPASCVTQTTPLPFIELFTSATLASPINVTSGQQIQVIVTITFS